MDVDGVSCSGRETGCELGSTALAKARQVEGLRAIETVLTTRPTFGIKTALRDEALEKGKSMGQLFYRGLSWVFTDGFHLCRRRSGSCVCVACSGLIPPAVDELMPLLFVCIDRS